jgi:hypothetical protein
MEVDTGIVSTFGGGGTSPCPSVPTIRGGTYIGGTKMAEKSSVSIGVPSVL